MNGGTCMDQLNAQGGVLAAGYRFESNFPALKQLPNIIYLNDRLLIFIIETCT